MLALAPLCVVWLCAGAALSVIDIREHRLPDRIVLPMYPVLAGVLALTGLLTGQWPLLRSLGGAGLWLAAIGSVWLMTSGRAMGFGDVKLAPLLGASLGWVSFDAALLGLMSCWILGGMWALTLLATHRVSKRDAIAFGPFMFLGLLAGIALGTSSGASALGL
ncbi:MAG: A24 family peptidase [Actinomycetota bacterium]|nr:A24 family peptidase [Actinomycetota bacterium]MDP2288340.1 A24 family peptidase [Actinomycetota bacterium]